MTQFKVVSTGDRKSTQRIAWALSYAFADVDPDLSIEDQKAIIGAVVRYFNEEGWIITKQLGRKT